MVNKSLHIAQYKAVDKHSTVIKWTIKNSASEETKQRILPAFYFDIIRPQRGYLIVDERKISDPFVSPILLNSKVITISRDALIEGFRFNPLYFKIITKIEPQKLEQKANQLSDLLEKDQSVMLLKNLLKIEINQDFTLLLNLKENQDVKLLRRTLEILIDNPNLPVIKAANANQVTDRWLQKLFKEYFNISPGDFKRLVKFIKTISSITHTKQNKLSSIGYDNNYFDQSHFIKNFKSFSGLLPSKFAKLEHDFFKVMNTVR